MKIAVIGAGNMATAILMGAKKAGKMPLDTFIVTDKMPEKLKEMKRLGFCTADSAVEAVRESEFFLIAVKPQDVEALLSSIREGCPDIGAKKAVTIAAGISSDYICDKLGCKIPVVRVMPNTPMTLGYGATAICRNGLVSDKDYSKICGLFAYGGEVASIKEEQMNAVIAVNSSSPAYFFEIVRIMTAYGVQNGIEEKVAATLARNAMLGSAKMLIESGKTPEELIAMVKSPKGTTAAALDSFAADGLEDTFKHAMDACTKRAEELGK